MTRRAATAPHGHRPAPRVVGIGELLWDVLPTGDQLGGAPFNLVAHLVRFGWNGAFISAVGDDDRGREALREDERLGVDTSWIAVEPAPTGVVRVTVDPEGVSAYEVLSPAAYERILESQVATVPSPVDLVVFGTLAQRFTGVRDATRRLTAASPNSTRLYDVNLRTDHFDEGLVSDLLRLASAAKLNDLEQRVVARALRLPTESTEAFARAAADRFDLDAVCVTRGPNEAALLLDGTYDEASAPSVVVIDTVGAGDGFTAALGHGLAMSWPVATILAVANRSRGPRRIEERANPVWDGSEIDGDISG